MSVGVVVILFNPDVEHIRSLIDAFCAPDWNVILVDTPSPQQALLTTDVTYLHYPSNIGIAHAQNVGLKMLFNEGSDYAFLLDQDSLFSPGIAVELIRQFQDLEQRSPIAAIGPSIYCQFSECVDQGVLQKGKQVSEKLKTVKQIIASGMLISKRAFERVGEKESELFIDGVDHEWCWRARAKGMLSISRSVHVCLIDKAMIE